MYVLCMYVTYVCMYLMKIEISKLVNYIIKKYMNKNIYKISQQINIKEVEDIYEDNFEKIIYEF